MKIIIDRFEGEYAIVELEVGRFLHIPKELLKGAKEGDIVRIDIDKKETKKRQNGV